HVCGPHRGGRRSGEGHFGAAARVVCDEGWDRLPAVVGQNAFEIGSTWHCTVGFWSIFGRFLLVRPGASSCLSCCPTTTYSLGSAVRLGSFCTGKIFFSDRPGWWAGPEVDSVWHGGRRARRGEIWKPLEEWGIFSDQLS